MNGSTCQRQGCGLLMISAAVPGATFFPRRLECPKHGYPQEKHSSLTPEEANGQDGAEMFDIMFDMQLFQNGGGIQ